MYLILKIGNKIFSPYSTSVCGFLLEYNGVISKKNIIKWLNEEYEITTSEIDIDNTQSNFIVVSMHYNDELYYGKLITFSTAIKHLTHVVIVVGMKFKDIFCEFFDAILMM